MKMIQRRLPRYYINNTNQSSPQQDIPDASLKQPQNRNSHSEVTVTDKDIKEVIENMAKTSVPGPDRITASIYKEYSDQLIYLIKKIWQISLESEKLSRRYCSRNYYTNL